ncbi:serine threonine kinase [Fusarium agapanthi]|uniref:Serine threonine kinase n=1 Tax=Fusarium agapanthi TaxID=1803897 RepID=A0A9P5EDR5_9HYPO|nr:serine threonine kinase [Fusarium agapanthi]
MEETLADIRLVGKSFFDLFYCTRNLPTTSVSPQVRYAEPGYRECYVVSVQFKDIQDVWDCTYVVGIDIPADIEFGYEEGVERLLDLARNVFLCQPTRLFVLGLFETGNQREFWLFDRSGVYRSGLNDDECDIQALLDVYGSMTELELGMNPFLGKELNGPKYVYIKGNGSQKTHYEFDHSGECKLVLDEEPLTCPDNIVSEIPTCYRATDKFNNEFVIKFSRKEQSQDEKFVLRRTKERNVWGITELIAYKSIRTKTTIISCAVIAPFGRPITEYRTVLEVLECMRDAIKAHRSLYIDAKILHRHVSIGNLRISNAGRNKRDASKGILIGFDTAMDVEIEPEKPYRLHGTKTFMAIDLSRNNDDPVLHTYRHDLESFFYVFLFIAVGGNRRVSDESRLRPWEVGSRNWSEIAEKKRKDISSNDNFAAILSEFSPDFKGLKSLAYALRDALFFPDGNEFFTGTNMDVEATERLYSAMIGAFENAVIENRK